MKEGGKKGAGAQHSADQRSAARFPGRSGYGAGLGTGGWELAGGVVASFWRGKVYGAWVK